MSENKARASTGFSERVQVRAAVDEAVSQALVGLAGRDPVAALVFATVGYDQAGLVDAVANALPDGLPIVGCSGEGLIRGGQSFEVSHALVVILLASDRFTCTPVVATGFSQGEAEAGQRIAEQVRAVSDARILLLFPDGITGNCAHLLDHLDRELPDVLIAGGTSGDMFAFEKTYQYWGNEAYTDAVVGLVLAGGVRGDVEVNHGCRPVGRELTVSRSSGLMVYEIDDRPVWEVFQDYVGERDTLDAMDISHLCVGRPVRGSATTEYGAYVIRMPVGQQQSGAISFPGGLEEGTVVRMTRRDPHRIRRAARQGAVKLSDDAPDTFLVLQFDCAGRGLILFGNSASESIAAPVRDAFAPQVPVVGLHTFGEIAPLNGNAEYHNYTVALLALTEER